jgi:putative colanic acid biosynthesis glycosyltransferase
MEFKKNHLFSIVSVALNNVSGLLKTRDSLALQSFRDFEWIIIDGDSTDGTVEALKDHKHFYSAPDRGLYDAMNKGIVKARGDYLLFLNAGDMLHGADTLEKISAALQNRKPGFVYGDSFEDGFYKRARSHNSKSWGMFTHHQSMLYAREKISNLRYSLDYKIGADYDFTCRFLKQIDEILYLPFPVCVFQTGGISQRDAKSGRREQFTIRKNLETNFAHNCFIYAAQSVAWTLRAMFPGLYWKFKSSGNSGNGPAQT